MAAAPACLPGEGEVHWMLALARGPRAGRGPAGRTAIRTLCNLSLRTASGPEGSSAKQTLRCAAGASGSRWVPAGPQPHHRSAHTAHSARVLQSSREEMAAAALRGRHRPEGGHADAAQRHRRAADCAVVRLCRAARRRQDDDRAHSGARPQLSAGADGRSLRHVRRLRRDRRRARHGRARDRRRHPHPGRQGPRHHHLRPWHRPRPRPPQGLHHRRSPPPLAAVVRRAAEVDRRAAAARGLHDGDDRARQGAGDDPVAFPGLRAQDDRGQADRRAAHGDCRGRADSD